MSPEDLKKFSALFGQFGQLIEKMKDRVQFPAARSESRLLAMLPASTVVYVAIPNYGETAHQALGAFRDEMQQNAELRAWWQKGDMAVEGPKSEQNLEKFYQLSQYLGDEVVISASHAEEKADPRVLVLAEVRKPGLKDFLRQNLKEWAGKGKPAAQVYDAAEFAAATSVAKDEPIILVGPDLVVLAENIATLRLFLEQREHKDQTFAAVEFGQRVAKAYEGGATIVAAADLQSILKLASSGMQSQVFQRSGFSDMKFLVWTHSSIAGQPASQVELSFTGPRRRVASWLAAPGPMSSLDYVSPEAAFDMTLLLKNPAEIFGDMQELASASNPKAFAGVDQVQRQMGVNLRDDLFARLAGEITIEIDRATPPDPSWRVFLKTNDGEGLLGTLNKFFAANRITPGHFTEDGITYYSVPVPSAQKVMEIGYAVVDGYLILGSSRSAVAQAVQIHHSGESLAKSSKFLAALPPGDSSEMSGLLYQNSTGFAAMTLSRASPELAEQLAKSATNAPASVMAVYGEDRALREVSRSNSMDVGGVLVVAAIAIPNLLRARMAANESSAIANIRTANTAQITYAAAYPQNGFAHDLASLGPNPKGPNLISPEHASLIDQTLGDATCTAGAWCVKAGYRFIITTACRQLPCREYAVIATPVSGSTGSRTFCSTSDGVVRFRIGAPLTSAATAVECRSWTRVQ